MKAPLLRNYDDIDDNEVDSIIKHRRKVCNDDDDDEKQQQRKETKNNKLINAAIFNNNKSVVKLQQLTTNYDSSVENKPLTYANAISFGKPFAQQQNTRRLSEQLAVKQNKQFSKQTPTTTTTLSIATLIHSTTNNSLKKQQQQHRQQAYNQSIISNYNKHQQQQCNSAASKKFLLTQSAKFNQATNKQSFANNSTINNNHQSADTLLLSHKSSNNSNSNNNCIMQRATRTMRALLISNSNSSGGNYAFVNDTRSSYKRATATNYNLRLANFLVVGTLLCCSLVASNANAWLLGDLVNAVSNASADQAAPSTGLSASASEKISKVVADAVVSGVGAAIAASKDSTSSSSLSSTATQLPTAASAQAPPATSASAVSTLSPAKAIAASLSSSLATAAAAGVAAAARNVAFHDASRVHSHAGGKDAPNANARHLVHKAVDSLVPEVPYNILHSMRKVDKAAPFYNLPNQPNRVFVGRVSEFPSTANAAAAAATAAAASTAQGIISNAGSSSSSSSSSLTSSSSAIANSPVASGLQQLSVLFRSPLLRRLAEGAGDFASEFRSLFRPANAPTSPLKSPSGITTASGASSAVGAASTSKLLRDLSVPAFIMLLVSALQRERPARNRRKSASPLAASSENIDQIRDKLAHLPKPLAESLYGPIDAPPVGIAPMFAPFANQIAPAQLVDPMLASGSSQVGDWRQAAPSPRISNNELLVNKHLQQNFELNNNNNKLPTINRRSGDQALISSFNEQQQQQLHQNSPNNLAIAARQQAAALFASLSAKLSKLMSPVGGQLSLSAATAGDNSALLQQTSRAQLDDKARYFLLPSDDLTSISGTGVAVPTVQKQAQNGEQRDLTQLLPQNWRDVLKRTVNSVQQSATTQFKSIEGQVSNWIGQDKRKPVNATTTNNAPLTSSTNNNNTTQATSASSMISAISSSAMNLLGFNGQRQQLPATNSTTSTTSTRIDNAALNGSLTSQQTNAAADNSPMAHAQKVRASLTGLAGSLVSTLANKAQQQLPAFVTNVGKQSTTAVPQAQQQQQQHQQQAAQRPVLIPSMTAPPAMY